MKKGSFIARHFPPPKSLLVDATGLDISDQAIKVVKLTKRGDNFALASYGEILLPKGTIKQGQVMDEAELMKSLIDARTKYDIDYVNSALPEEKAYVVELEVPRDSASLRETVELHIEEHIPLSVGEIVFDYELVNKSKSSRTSRGNYEVALCAVAKDVSETYYSNITGAGIRPLGFELESHALARALVQTGDQGTHMILDIGREQSNLSILSDGIVRLTSSIAVGGNAMDKAIIADLGVSEQDATRVKEELGLLHSSSDKRVFYSIVRVATALRDEINQRFFYWKERREKLHRDSAINSIILCGGNASVPGLPQYLSSGVDVPVVIGNPWINVLSFDKEVPQIPAREALKYSTAIGLALRNFVSK